MLNHSTVPLRMASLLGIFMLAVSLMGALYYFILRWQDPDLPRGLASLHILVLFGTGLISFLLGVIGEYILRIYLLLRAEPVAIVESSLNIPKSEIKL